MIWSLIAQVGQVLMDVLSLRLVADVNKDLELLVLRQQIRILERRLGKPVRPSRVEKLLLTLSALQIKERARAGQQSFKNSLLLFKPATVLKWHRELVKRKWTFQHRAKLGRPRLDEELEALIVRLAQENPGLGYEKLQGELEKLGYDVGISTVRDVLKRHHIPPAPERDRTHRNWRTFLNHYRTQMLACDFFTVETVFLQTVYVLFFIEVSTRRVYLAGCTHQPDSAWVTQQARQALWQLQDRQPAMRFLIHDRDTKFSGAFETVFAAEGIGTVLTPYRAPNANAVAERWVRSVREECLDQLLIVSPAHLRRVLREYVDYYNTARPHQGLKQQAPIPFARGAAIGPISCRDVLGGILHDYQRQVA
jgi:transposase InsO family protein